MPRVDLSGQRFDRLTVVEYDRSIRKWLCICECGTCCHRTTGALNRGSVHTCGNRKNHKVRQPLRDFVTYSGAHMRVREIRGTATAFPCSACRTEVASNWAYDHRDPNEIVDPRNGPYSADPARYRPLCVSCHKVADLARISQTPGQMELIPLATAIELEQLERDGTN